jgi:N-acetylmuramoyl-L-alanine amidase
LYKKIDVPAQIINDRTYVPVRVIFEALGAEVDWDDATKTVLSSKAGKTVNLPTGRAVVIVDGVEQTVLPSGNAVSEALIVDSRTLVPARVAAEAYGGDVAWDGATRTVTITLE